MGRNKTVYKGYTRTDFSELLNELNGVQPVFYEDGALAIQEDVFLVSEKQSQESVEGQSQRPVEGQAQESVEGQSQESEERHRVMSDEKIKYLYSKDSPIIHCKQCACVKTIADEDLRVSESYVKNMHPCPKCKMQAYVANSARDPKEISMYQLFFAKTKMSEKQIRRVFVEKEMKTRISPDALTIWYKDDTWRIKLLPKKGHVQLYHNNYIVRKKGVREFTQGFHIQNQACTDTDIGYALIIIENYEYKPENAALHSNAGNQEAYRKRKLKKVEMQDRKALSLEEMLGEKSAPKTFWKKVKDYFYKLIHKDNFFELNDFHLVSEEGYPPSQTVCVYIWKDKNDELFWQTGLYNKNLKLFSVRFGNTSYAIRQNKVVAWKKMNADATALSIL